MLHGLRFRLGATTTHIASVRAAWSCLGRTQIMPGATQIQADFPCVLIRRLLVVSLLLVPWHSAEAFLPRAVLPQQQQQQQQQQNKRSQSKRDHDKQEQPGRPPRATTVIPTAAVSRRHESQCTLFAAAESSTSTDAEHGAAGARATGTPARKATPKKCGTNFEGTLTRSDAVASTISASLAAAGLSLRPRRATAEETGDMEATPVLLKKEDLAGLQETKYKVGSDEVGVLFGDGPIGIKLGDNPLKTSGVCRVYVTEVLAGSQAIRQANIKAGFGVAAVGGKPAARLEPKEVADLIRVSPRPMEIVFRDPELLGKRLGEEADKRAAAAKRSRQKAADDKAAPATPASNTSPGELRVTQAGKKPTVCGTRSKAGDLIEFRYSARLANDMSVEFDSSDRRGTGLPYAIVLGNGDVVKGLDLSLFDMCVGERRKIEVPARLAYGRKGSKVFGIPPDDGLGSADVVYGVELVSINFRSDPSEQRDNFYTDDPCDAAAFSAGNASGKCNK